MGSSKEGRKTSKAFMAEEARFLVHNAVPILSDNKRGRDTMGWVMHVDLSIGGWTDV